MTYFNHDCDKCTPLGQYNDHDLYHCEQGGMPTIIARFSDEPADYKSGLVFKDVDPELQEAARRAIMLNLKMVIAT
jgi:hypothetical protein